MLSICTELSLDAKLAMTIVTGAYMNPCLLAYLAQTTFSTGKTIGEIPLDRVNGLESCAMRRAVVD